MRYAGDSMYPELFTIPFLDWPVSSFGAAMATAFLVGYWIAIPRMAEEGLDPDGAANMLIWIMAGGVFGAKLYYATDFSLRGEAEFWSSLFSRAGMVFYGGLIGGAVAGIAGCRFYKIAPLAFANVVAVPLAVGQAIGRIGCLLVGDDYGRATDLPWGIAFPQGLPPVHYPVHPTQIYESAWLFLVALLLWRRRKKSPSLMGEYLVLNGIGRTIIEHWRLNPRVALDLSEAQWIGVGLIFVGGFMLLRAHKTSADQSEVDSNRS